ncbi:MAG: serine/threonine protein kinase [Proteobacteria bacterium]|nr:serine/threonine protein kinase [Pseudomonadota bacterium]
MAKPLVEGDYLEGRYRILRHIGEGGMGVVYEAEHVLLKRRCAVKVLHPSEANDDSMIERFKIEARSAANIHHPNIVEVMDFGLTPDNRPFFVMEYLTGRSLADKLESEVRLSENEAVEITDQILSGLIVAHRAGVVHRDLKPENIHLTRDEKKHEVVKILDFGISKIVAGTSGFENKSLPSGSQQLTQGGVVLGTPGYMAPESLFGSTDVDARADIFSVGVVLFEMVIGRRLYRGSNAHELMVANAAKPVPIPSRIRPEISDSMERVILTALAKNPDDRYRNAEQFLYNLSAAAVGRTASKAPPCKTKTGIPSMIPQISKKTAPLELETIEPPQKSTFVSTKSPRSISKAQRRIEIFNERATNISKPKRSRRFSFKISPAFIVFFIALGGAAYYIFVHEDPMIVTSSMDPIDKRIRDIGTSNQKSIEAGSKLEQKNTSSKSQRRPSVTIWLDAHPRVLLVFWDGKQLFERPLIVPVSNVPAEVRFSASGYLDERRMITSDREQTIKVRLKKATKKKRARSKRSR